MMLVNDFVERLYNIVNNYKTLYVMGCFGSPMTKSNKERYKNNHSFNKYPKRQAMIDRCDDNTFGFDCVNLIKGVLWGWTGDKTKSYGGAKYCSNGVPDVGADKMISLCKNVSTDFSKINIGEAVWMSGHIGVYVGDNKVIECSPAFKNCVQVTNLNQRKWLKHGYLPYIDYSVKSKELTKEQKWMIDNGYIKGYGDNNYGWDDTLTRRQLAIILYRMVNGNGSDK